MKETDRLMFGMGFLFIFFMVSFGAIIINEKINIKKLPDAKEKIETYIIKNYSEEKNEFKIEKTTYNASCSCYKAKVTNKNNKNLYFKVTYKNKKLTDTYKKDYKEGNTLLKTIEKSLTKEFQELNKSKRGIDESLKIKIDSTLNNFNPSIKKEIILSKDYKSLNIYKIEGELIIDTWTFDTINKQIISFNNTVKKQGFNPISYNFYITNPKQSGESFIIENLKTNYINENILNELVPAIKDNNKDILKKYNY